MKRRNKIKPAIESIIALLTSNTSAWAHGGAEKLVGHHWEDADYIGEIRLQVGLMLLISVLFATAYIVRKISRKKVQR